MSLVLDCSVILPWFLEDERTAFTDALFASVGREECWVPSVWCLEFANALLVAERRRRIDRATRWGIIERVASLRLLVDTSSIDMKAISNLAERHALSAYDAAYLELSMRQGLGLATLDRALADAAAAEGVEVQSSGRGSAAQPRTRYPARPKRRKPTA